MNGKHKKFIVDVRSVYCHESGQEVKKASIADNAMLKEHDRKESKSGGRQGKERGRRGSGELGSWSSLTVKSVIQTNVNSLIPSGLYHISRPNYDRKGAFLEGA
uniref:Uncharacterized protein n=1 Tax=Loa loa TaxID=7209 RepID=A0A1I7VG42_LOALO